MSKQEATSKYDQLNAEVVAALKRMSDAVGRRALVAVEIEDKNVIRLLAEMRAVLRLM